MKNKLLIFILIIGIKFNAQESFRAFYNISFENIDTIAINNNLNRKNEKSISKSKEIIKNKVRIKMRNQFKKTISLSKRTFLNLDFNRILSKFYLPNKIETRELKTFKRFARYKGEYFSDGKNIFHKKNSFGQDFIVKKPKLDWDISKITKKIGKYLCYKAITLKRIETSMGVKYTKVIAWFSPEIPFNHGPKGYVGLPGLIIKLDEGNLSYVLKKIIKLDSIKFIKPSKGKKITLEEFNILSKKMYKNREKIVKKKY